MSEDDFDAPPVRVTKMRVTHELISPGRWTACFVGHPNTRGFGASVEQASQDLATSFFALIAALGLPAEMLDLKRPLPPHVPDAVNDAVVESVGAVAREAAAGEDAMADLDMEVEQLTPTTCAARFKLAPKLISIGLTMEEARDNLLQGLTQLLPLFGVEPQDIQTELQEQPRGKLQ